MRTGWTNKPGVERDITKTHIVYGEDMQDIADELNENLPAMFKNLYLNLVLAFFKLSVYAGLVKFNLVDGFIDEYEDQSGVDLVNSENISYNSTNDYYSPSASASGILPKAHWKMNDNAANTNIDDNIGGFDITAPRNTNAMTVAGKINTAINLAGNETGSAGNVLNVTTGDFSICCWIKCGAQNNVVGIVLSKERESPGFQFGIRSSGKVYGFIKDAGGTVGSTDDGTVCNDGAWHHIAVVFDRNGNMTRYVDGNTTGTADNISARSGSLSNSYNLSLGYFGATTYSFKGAVDDLRFYDSALEEADIDEIYNSGSGTEDEGGDETYDDLLLISNAVFAEDPPTNARIVIFEEDVDEITLNTDLKAYVSRDGIDYTEITLTDEGEYESGKRIVSGYLPFTSDTGTDIKYKIESLNNKNLKIHGTAVQWD